MVEKIHFYRTYKPFKPNPEHEKWLLDHYSMEQLKDLATATFGCRYGKCEGCDRDCGANDVRHVIALHT